MEQTLPPVHSTPGSQGAPGSACGISLPPGGGGTGGTGAAGGGGSAAIGGALNSAKNTEFYLKISVPTIQLVPHRGMGHTCV
jgi:hypothetical protein